MNIDSKILILGGTQLLGRDTIENLLSKDYTDISYANRGLTNPNLFSNLKFIKYDRNSDTNIGQENYKYSIYDYIIDFSCYSVNQFISSINTFQYKKYIYISTLSVFDYSTINNTSLKNNYYWYCFNKLKIEEYIISTIKNNLLIVRPCAIYGEYDYTNRFYKKNNQYYLVDSNKQINNEHGYMYVRDFSNKLIDSLNIDTSKNIVAINII